MLKLCVAEIAIPLQIIFQDCINSGNVQHIHKNNNRQIKSNYRPISLLPICGKSFEKIVFDQFYAFLNVNNLLSKNNLVLDQVIRQYTNFYPLHQLSMKRLKIMTSAIFLDISKAFDKVWHDGII